MKRWKISLWIAIGIVIILALWLAFASSPARAFPGTNIDPFPADHFAWNDLAAWIDFYSTDAVQVLPTSIAGYASSSIGEIVFDCASSPSGNICGQSNFGVCNGPGPHVTDGTCTLSGSSGSGILTGYTWNNLVGWISMNCDQTSHGGGNACVSADYKTWIDPTTGIFTGWAWNDIIGWISFNCIDYNGCGNSNYRVETTWRATSTIGFLESGVFDTKSTGGATLNSIIWHGAQPPGTSVDFQIAVSNNVNGPWNFRGPGGDATLYYGTECPAGNADPAIGPDTSICIDYDVSGFRFLKYKVRLKSDRISTISPAVEDIILNWSP